MVDENLFFETPKETFGAWTYAKTAFRDAIGGAAKAIVRLGDRRLRIDFERFIGDGDLAELTMSSFPTARANQIISQMTEE